MQSSSRRAFLRGRTLPQSPWEQFCQRLRRTVTGEFIEFQVSGAAGSGRLTVQHTTDIHHVRALCDEYGVVLSLDGLSMPARHPDQPTIWVRAGKALSGFRRIEEGSNKWFVQPGCTVGELAAAGLHQLDHLPATMTLACWLADRTVSDYAIGQTSRSGLEHAALLLGDGQVVTLGPFARQNTRPLDGLRLQQLVPALFRLASGTDASFCLGAGFWPSRYRLDALMPVEGTSQNLAHLILGHGGDLGWLEWAVIDGDLLDVDTRNDVYFSSDLVEEGGWGDAATTLDWEVKALFDPHSVFSSFGQSI